MRRAVRLVDNVAVRQAVSAFAAEPAQRSALEVLRSCMYGELLFDITGSDGAADGSFAAGSRLQIRRGTGPGGGSALFAFTRNEEIARLYPLGTRTQSLVTPATGALELARHHGDAWLYIDPAGPTCALSAAEIDFALRNPRNEPLKDALAALQAGRVNRLDVLTVLRQEGPLLLAADDRAVPGKVIKRSVTMPDGSTALLGFTSAAEVVASDPSDAVAAFTTAQVLEMVRRDGYSGLIIDPAEPSITVALAELAAT